MPQKATLDATHDPALRSWVASANEDGSDFPIQNLPFGRFRERAGSGAWRIGVAIGDQVLDLQAAHRALAGDAQAADALALVAGGDLKPLMAAGPAPRRALRAALSRALAQGSTARDALQPCLVAQSQVELGVPCAIGDYTDFYTGVHHATAAGRQFRPDNPLLPNYQWVPIGYHGRSSSIVASGHAVRRPRGQTKAPDAQQPVFGPCRRLDYEVELGFLTAAGNALGEPIPIDRAEDHLFGVTLFNDWSARDIQGWEYQPLGPFLSKNFASTISPWVVTMEALAPFRAALQRPAGMAQPLPYLDAAQSRERGALAIRIEAWLQTPAMRARGEAPVRLSTARADEAACWTPAQLIAHHTSGGCNLQPGDLLGSGTLSGTRPEEAGSLLELTVGGKQPLTLPGGEQRTFLEDGDTVILRGACEGAGARRIGFGECAGMIVAA